jgi:hypothetical protein
LLPINNTLVIAPTNDLESKTIHDIAQLINLARLELIGTWGCRLTLEYIEQNQHHFEGKTHLIIVELPDEASEAELRRQGFVLHIVDHHRYSDLDRSHTQTSIEQFCHLIGNDMSRYHWLVAYNDQDFIPGLHKSGAKYKEMLDIRSEDRQAQGQGPKLKEDYSYHALKMDDLDILLAPSGKDSVGLAEYWQTPTAEAYKENSYATDTKPCLLLFYTPDAKDPVDAIDEIAFYGKASQRDAINEVITNSNWQRDFKLWSGGGHITAFMGAACKIGVPKANINGLVNDLFDRFLVTGKPLLDYNCTFYLPLDLYLENELGKKLPPCLSVKESGDIERVKIQELQLQLDEYKELKSQQNENDANKNFESVQNKLKQASEYVYTRVQDQMFEINKTDTSNPTLITPTKHFCVKPNTLVDTTWTLKSGITASVEDVSLYQYHNGLSILAVKVKMPELQQKPNDIYADAWWKLMLHSVLIGQGHVWQDRQVQHWLHFSRMSRIFYGNFIEQAIEYKIEKMDWISGSGGSNYESSKNGDFNGIFVALLRQFFPDVDKQDWKRNKRLKQVHSSVAHVQVAYSLPGPCPVKNNLSTFAPSAAYLELERLFTLALYVDTKHDGYDCAVGYAYDRDYIHKQLLPKHRYQRWDEIGTFIGFAPYAGVYLGYGDFFNKVIAGTHVPYVYGRMTVECLFYRLSFAHFDRRITKSTKSLVNRKHFSKEFRDLRGNFIEFANYYWVRQLTPEIQGMEIYGHMSRALELEQDYVLIKDQMERADEYSTVLRDGFYGKLAFWLAIIAIISASAALNHWGLLVPEFIKNFSFWNYSIWNYRDFFWTVLIALIGLYVAIIAIGPIYYFPRTLLQKIKWAYSALKRKNND